MRSYRFHSSVELITQAASLSKTNFTMIASPELSFLRRRLPRKIQPALTLLSYFFLVFSLYSNYRKYDLILVREFLTLPFFCFAGLLLPLRKKLCLVNNHNLQKAVSLRSQRWAFRLLCKAGFKLVFLEKCAGLEALNIPFSATQFFCVPQPVFPVPDCSNEVREKKRVGIIGDYRPEKGMESLFSLLPEIKEKAHVDLLIGTTKSESVLTRLGSFKNEVELVDTTDSAAYAEALMRCDIILFSYTKGDYFYRPSGVVVNAIECGASVVCPDYPVFRQQTLFPHPVGCLYENDAAILDAVLRAVQGRPQFFKNIPAYIAQRTPEKVATLIDAFARANGLIAP